MREHASRQKCVLTGLWELIPGVETFNVISRIQHYVLNILNNVVYKLCSRSQSLTILARLGPQAASSVGL